MNDRLKMFHVKLSDTQLEQFKKYYEILVEWNSFMNLTAITEYEEVKLKHFIDSLSIVKVDEINNFDNINKIIDIGTGAGFPAIPLKIAFPDMEFTLVDSLNKRVKFLNEVIDKLSLKGIKAYHSRAEEFARDKLHREQYDLCLSRAVARLNSLSEYCLPFVKMDGLFIPYKSGKLQEEINDSKKAIHILGGKLINTYQFNLPDSDIERSFAVIKKGANTNKKYPRANGKPTKDPIS